MPTKTKSTLDLLEEVTAKILDFLDGNATRADLKEVAGEASDHLDDFDDAAEDDEGEGEE